MISGTKNNVTEPPHKCPYDLRLNPSKFGTMEKSQRRVKTKPSTRSPFQKNFGTSGQKLRKNRCQHFFICPILLDFLHCFIHFVRDCRFCYKVYGLVAGGVSFSDKPSHYIMLNYEGNDKHRKRTRI